MSSARPRPKPVDLTTERFSLRSLRAEDATQRFMGWLVDPEIMKPFNGQLMPLTREQLARYIGLHDNIMSFLVGIFENSSGQHIGNYQVIVDRQHQKADFHVYIGDKAYWGEKVVMETRAALLDHFFCEQGIEKAIGGPPARNFPAIFNYKAQGWRLEGILKAHMKSHFGEGRLDVYQFALLKDEWLATRTPRQP